MDEAPGHPDPNVSPARGRRSGWARLFRYVLVVALFVVALTAFATSLLPYDRLSDRLDPLSVDRSADLTRAEFDEIVLRLRLVAIGLSTLAIALLAMGRRIDVLVDDIGRSWWSAARGIPAAFRSWLGSESRAYVASFALICAVGVALRLAYLDVPLRYDEATTFNNFVSKPLHVALANYATPNNHLLHTFLAKVSVTIFGNAEWALRLPALLAGLVLIPASFALGRVLFGRAAALLTAALVASSSTLVEYSTNARGYTLVCLLAVVAFLAAVRVVETDATGTWAALASACALGLYAVPVMLYFSGGVLVWIVASRWLAETLGRDFLRHTAWAAVVTAVVTLVLYAPVLAASGVGSITANEFVEPRTWASFVDALPGHVADTLATWTRDLPFVLAAAVTFGIVAGIGLGPRISRYAVSAVVAVVAWSVVVLALQRVVPYTRVWLPLLPLALAACAGFYGWLLERPRTRAPGTLAAGAAALVSVGGALLVLSADSVRESRETGALLDAPAIADVLAARARPGDRILATGSDTILEYYLARRGFDAAPLLYATDPRQRSFVVVNVLGGQTIDELLVQLGESSSLASPELITSYPSGRVYVVERRA